mmetsp:Transcript_623/g.2398  ORF Transcript_623/g.2398 Transcript_623/m.2398 type:complete len:200 (-) Transcript_623:809-1408(-)
MHIADCIARLSAAHRPSRDCAPRSARSPARASADASWSACAHRALAHDGGRDRRTNSIALARGSTHDRRACRRSRDLYRCSHPGHLVHTAAAAHRFDRLPCATRRHRRGRRHRGATHCGGSMAPGGRRHGLSHLAASRRRSDASQARARGARDRPSQHARPGAKPRRHGAACRATHHRAPLATTCPSLPKWRPSQPSIA